MSDNENDPLPELERGSRAVHIADLADVIEAERGVVRRLRRWVIPGNIVGILLATSVLALDVAVRAWAGILLLLLFSAVLARNTLRYRRHAARLAELEAQLAELEESGSPAALAPSDARTDLPG